MKSASNRQMTLLRKLGRKKYRQNEQLYVLEGRRAVKQRIKVNPEAVKGLFFDEDRHLWEQPDWQQVSAQPNKFILESSVFAEVTDTDHPQGVLALCRMPPQSSIKEMAVQQNLVIALDAIRDPGNLGTMIRTAVWFGAGGLISGKGTVDLFHPKVVRSTAGATGALPFVNADLSQALPEFERAGWPVFMLDAGEDAAELSKTEQMQKAVIVVGNEAHGLSPELITGNRTKVRIASPDASPAVESLNAAVATSIALYEFSRKIGPPDAQ